MRKFIFTAFAMASLSATAQNLDASKAPVHIQVAFSQRYPGVQDVKWEQEKGNFEATFTKDGKKMSVLMNGDGKLMETETSIPATELPTKAAAYMRLNFKGKKIRETARIVLADGSLQFEAAIKGKDVIFDKDGNFVKIVKD